MQINFNCVICQKDTRHHISPNPVESGDNQINRLQCLTCDHVIDVVSEKNKLPTYHSRVVGHKATEELDYE